MTGFESQTSDVRIDRSVNWATTPAQIELKIHK